MSWKEWTPVDMLEMGHLPAQILDKLMGLEESVEHAHCWGMDKVDTHVGIVADVVAAVAGAVGADT